MTNSTKSTIRTLIAGMLLIAMVGCRGGKDEQEKDEFFTSGSREADQRASQRIARDQQLAGGEEDKNVTEAEPEAVGAPGSGKAAQAEGKLTLYERLGGEQGITAIVEDFTQRVLADPRVNWERKGVTSGGFFRRDQSVAWNATPENVGTLKKHLVQFLALATGGPAQYGGKEMKAVHANMQITNPEFDAAVGDLKATLDKLQFPTQEQKELLAILESTRPQIVTER